MTPVTPLWCCNLLRISSSSEFSWKYVILISQMDGVGLHFIYSKLSLTAIIWGWEEGFTRFTLNCKSLQKLYLNEVIKAEGGRGLHVWWIVQRPKFGSWSPQPRPRPIWWQNVKFEWWVTWPLLQCPLIKQTWVKHVQCKKQIFIFYVSIYILLIRRER